MARAVSVRRTAEIPTQATISLLGRPRGDLVILRLETYFGGEELLADRRLAGPGWTGGIGRWMALTYVAMRALFDRFTEAAAPALDR